MCESLRRRISKIINLVAQEGNLLKSKDIGEYLMEIKIIGEKLMEKFDPADAYSSNYTFKKANNNQHRGGVMSPI